MQGSSINRLLKDFSGKWMEVNRRWCCLFGNYKSVFEFSITLCIRLDTVQDIVNQFSGVPQQYHDETYTSLTQLGYFEIQGVPGLGVRYKTQSGADISETIGEISTLIKDQVVPFFEKYKDINSLYQGLNPEGIEKSNKTLYITGRNVFDSSNQPYKAMTAITVAYLRHDVRLPQLLKYYLNQIIDLPPRERGKLGELLEFMHL